jgi:T5SS/PEP-CTERM-associated repeat protein
MSLLADRGLPFLGNVSERLNSMRQRISSNVGMHFVGPLVLLIAACAIGRANAAVTPLGAVNPAPPVGGGVFSGQLVVGDDQSSNNDIRGWLRVDQGTLLQYGTLIIGDEEDFFGEVNVQGNFIAGQNTQFNLSGAGSSLTPTVQIGRDGFGTLNISGGATMSLTSAGGNLSVGVRGTAVGSLSVEGPFSILTAETEIIVGQAGIANMAVTDGALVRTISTSAARGIRIGTDATGVGTLRVEGAGSVLRSGSNVVVGGLGQGTLIIGDDAIVDVDTVLAARTTVGPFGRIELDGGTLIGNKPAPGDGFGTTVNGFFGGAGLVRSTVSFSDTSRLGVGPDDLLRFDGNVSNQGAVTIDDGELQFLAGFTNNAQGGNAAPGRVTLQDGTLDFANTLVNNGVISSARGVNNIHGEITNQGAIVVASDTVATFHDAVTDNGGSVTVLPRGNALFLADVMFQSASLLELSIGLDDVTDNSAQISSAGEVTLDGELSVLLDSSYTPMLGDTFELITAASGISGTFDTTSFPNIGGGLEFRLNYSPSDVTLAVVVDSGTAPLAGDYNRDGAVDAADYVVWRNALGGSTSLPNDDTPGVGPDDYSRWRSNFGRTAAAVATSSAASSATPEPASILMAMLAAVLLNANTARRRRAVTH